MTVSIVSIINSIFAAIAKRRWFLIKWKLMNFWYVWESMLAFKILAMNDLTFSLTIKGQEPLAWYWPGLFSVNAAILMLIYQSILSSCFKITLY